MMMKPHILVTHASSFHADEAMAIALLERFYLPSPSQMTVGVPVETQLEWIEGKSAPVAPRLFHPDGVEECRTPSMVIRTRDKKLLAAACANKDVFVIDVGGVFDNAMLNFDHHQSSMKKAWPDGTPFSSTGLIWKWLEENNLLNALHEEVKSEIEERLVKALDAHDNGVANSPVASQMSGFNRSSEDADLQSIQFGKAKQLMAETLDNYIFTAELKLEAKEILKKGWEKAKKFNDTHVLLREHIAYHDCTTLLKEISGGVADMIVIPGQGNRFSVISTPKDTAFSIKTPCPESWRGKMDQTLNIDGKQVMLRFAHKTGFMCVVEGTHKDAQLVARYIIAQNKMGLKSTQAKPARSTPNSSKPSNQGFSLNTVASSEGEHSPQSTPSGKPRLSLRR